MRHRKRIIMSEDEEDEVLPPPPPPPLKKPTLVITISKFVSNEALGSGDDSGEDSDSAGSLAEFIVGEEECDSEDDGLNMYRRLLFKSCF
jgi:hypothetical protein